MYGGKVLDSRFTGSLKVLRWSTHLDGRHVFGDIKILDLARFAPLVPGYCIVRSSAQMALQPLVHRLYKIKATEIGSHTFFWTVGVWLGETQHVKYETVQLKKIGKLWGMICFNVLSNLLYNLLQHTCHTSLFPHIITNILMSQRERLTA